MNPDGLPQGDASPRAWVLLSGGIDSTACIAFYLKEGFQVDCLHIAFGQPSSPHEQVAARRVTRHYGVPLSILRWAAATRFTTGEIVGRNAFMCLGALLELGDVAGVLAIGIHAGTPYYDCSRDFVSDMQRVIDGYCDGRLRLGAPFVEWSKRDVYEFARAEGLPVRLTYSCETGTDPPCGRCLSCGDRTILDAL